MREETTEEETTEDETTETTEEVTDIMTGTIEEATEDIIAAVEATLVAQDVRFALFVIQFQMPSFFQSLKDTKRRYTQKLRIAAGNSIETG